MAEKESGIKAQHGYFYVLKLIALFFKEGCKSGKPFYISVEKGKTAGAFDDIIFKWKEEDGSFTSRLLQAKHKRIPGKSISCKAFTDRYGDFSFVKYFLSYCAIKRNQDYPNVKDFILYSNANFEEEKLENKGILVQKIKSDDIFIEDSYKLMLSDNLSALLKESIDAKALAKSLFNKTLDTNEAIDEKKETFIRNLVLKTYRMALNEEVIDKCETGHQVADEKLTLFQFKKTFQNDEILSNQAQLLRHQLQICLLSNATLKITGNPDKSIESSIKEVSDENLEKLATLLDKCAADGSQLKLEILQKSFPASFIEEIINIKDKKFRLVFISSAESLSPTAKKLRNMLFTKNKIFTKKLTLPGNIFSSNGKFTKLLSDVDIDQLIQTFCEDFVLALNQADGEDIDEVLRKEFGELFDLNNSALIANQLHHNITEWIKKVSDKELTHDDFVDFKKHIKSELLRLQVADRSEQYCKEFANHNIQYEETCPTQKFVKEFIRQNTKNVLRICTKSSMLTSINVLEAIKTVRLQGDGKNKLYFKMRDSFIFLPSEKIDVDVLEAFTFDCGNNLLVIVNDDLCHQILIQICQLLKNSERKKLILISEKSENRKVPKFLEFATDIFVESYNDKSFFQHLKEKQKLLNKRINFHGYSFLLNELIHDEKFYEVIDGRILGELLTKDNVEIGKAKHTKKADEIGIARYVRLFKIDEELFEKIEKLKNQIFCIEGKSEKEMWHFLKEKNISEKTVIEAANFIEMAHKYDTSSRLNPENLMGVAAIQVIILNSTIPEIQFKEICQIQKNNILSQIFQFHWLKYNIISDKENENTVNRKNLIWICSSHLLTNTKAAFALKPFFQKNEQLVNENEFLNTFSQNQIGIICNEAGAGKSTTLSRLSQIYDKSYWHIRIDLNQHTKLLALKVNEKVTETYCAIFKFCEDTNKYDELLLEELLNAKFLLTSTSFVNFVNMHVQRENLSLENYLFLYCFYRGKLLIMLDGFDEISPAYSNLVLKLVTCLNNMTSNKIWITSRPNHQRSLESSFNTFAYSLEPFTNKEQKQYLIDVWKLNYNGKCNEELCEKIENHATWVMERFKKFLPKNCDDFMGIPLKMKMIAEIFMESIEMNEAEKELNSKKIPNLYSLYKKFVTKKIQRFLEKTGADLSKAYGKKLNKVFRHYEHKIHEILGFYQLTNDYKELLTTQLSEMIPKKDLKLVEDWISDFQKGIENVGMIKKNYENEELIFDHLTYAEYFCAHFLANKLKNSPNLKEEIFIIVNKICEKYVPVFVSTFHYLLRQDIGFDELHKILDGMSPIVFATKHGFTNCMEEFMKDENFRQNFPFPDECGKTLLHHAAKSEQIPAVVFILINAWFFILQKKAYKLEIFMATLLEFIDTKDGENKTVIDYEYQNKDLQKLIIEIRTACVFSFKLRVYPSLTDMIGYSEKNEFNGCYHIQSLLYYCSFSSIWNICENVYRNELFYLFSSSDANFIDDLCSRTDLKEEEKIKILKYLWETFFKEDKHIVENIIISLIKNGCFHLFQIIFDGFQPCDFPENFLLDCLEIALQNGDIAAINALNTIAKDITNKISYKKIYKKTSTNVLKHFFSLCKLDVEDKDIFGRTMLCRAVYFGYPINFLEYLIDKGANPNVTDNEGYNAWTYAVLNEEFAVLEYLIKTCTIDEPQPCSITSYFMDSWLNTNELIENKTRLIHAVLNKSVGQVQFLLVKGADVNISDEFGNTALHYSCEHNCLEISKKLMDYGANFERQNNAGKCPKDLCLSDSKINDFCEKAKLDFSHNTTDLGISWGRTNATNANYQTLWHIAANNKSNAALKKLIKTYHVFSTINFKDSNGDTALHVAAKNCNREFVEELLKYGAFYNIKNLKNETPLQVAKNENNTEIIQSLSNTEKLFHALNQDAEYLNDSICLELFGTEIDNFYYHIKDKYGRTLAHYVAIKKCHILAQHFASISLDYINTFEDLQQHTPLYYAFENNDIQMIRLFLKLSQYTMQISKKDLNIAAEEECKNLSNQLKKLSSCLENEDIDEIKNIIIDSNNDTDILINAKIYGYESVFSFALDNTDSDFVNMLLKKGAIVRGRDGSFNNRINRELKYICEIFENVKRNQHDPKSIIQQIENRNFIEIILNVQYYSDEGKPQTLLQVATESENQEMVQWCQENITKF